MRKERDLTMKRVCTQEEKELLLKNKKQMLQGINWSASRGSFGYKVASILVSLVIAFAVAIVLTLKTNVSELLIWVIWAIVEFICSIIFWLIFNSIRVKKATREFLTQDSLMVNGVTIVSALGPNLVSYIEDDVHDENGKPIIIDYPSTSYEVTAEDIGNRAMIMYDKEGNFQIVKLNDSLKGMVPSYSADYPLAGTLEDYVHVPHLNMLRVDREDHAISDSERPQWAKKYVKIVQSMSVGMLKKMYPVLFFIIAFLCVMLNYVEDGVPFEKSLPIAIPGYLGLGVFFFLCFLLGKVNLRRQGQFTHVKEVVFRSYQIGNNSAFVQVYEWVDGKPVLNEYFAGNVSTKTKFGTILYKFTNKKGDAVLLNTAPIGNQK